MIATMFSAVNSPTPRVVFGMVGFVSLVLAGTLRAALLICRALWAFGVQSWLATCYGGLFGLVSCPVRAVKRAAPIEPPIVGRFALSSVISTRRKMRYKPDCACLNFASEPVLGAWCRIIG